MFSVGSWLALEFSAALYAQLHLFPGVQPPPHGGAAAWGGAARVSKAGRGPLGLWERS